MDHDGGISFMYEDKIFNLDASQENSAFLQTLLSNIDDNLNNESIDKNSFIHKSFNC